MPHGRWRLRAPQVSEGEVVVEFVFGFAPEVVQGCAARGSECLFKPGIDGRVLADAPAHRYGTQGGGALALHLGAGEESEQGRDGGAFGGGILGEHNEDIVGP